MIVCGTADETLPANRAMHDRLTSLHIAHEYVELEGVAHEPLRSIRAMGSRLWKFVKDALR
jgi:acetyl esterase/lipase